MSQPAPGSPAPVLFVHSGRNWIRGSEQCLLDLVRHLDRRRFAPVVCCDSAPLARAAAELGVPVHQVDGWDASAARWLPDRAHVRHIRRLVGNHRIRLIHANDTDPLKVLVPVARQFRLPLLAHLHIVIDAAERRWSFLHQVAMAVGVSAAAVEGLLEDGFPASRTTIVYNGVDPARIERGDARRLRTELGIPHDAVVFTALGSLIARKGVDVTLAAFELLAVRRPESVLLFCGEGEQRAALESRARLSPSASRIHFLGERQEAGAVLRDATNVLVSAARTEAFPLSILEAAYFGLPIVASDIPPHREFLGDGRAGLLFPPADPAQLAAAMERFAADGDFRRVAGQAGRDRVRGSHLVSHVIERFDRIYTTLLHQPSEAFGWFGATSWPPSYTRWLRAAVVRRVWPISS